MKMQRAEAECTESQLGVDPRLRPYLLTLPSRVQLCGPGKLKTRDKQRCQRRAAASLKAAAARHDLCGMRPASCVTKP